MFVPSVSPLESVIRGTVIFFVVFVLMRIVGKRESGGLSLTDVLLVVLISESASAGLHGSRAPSAVTDAAILVITLLFWSVALDAVSYRFPRLSGFLKARPVPLIDRGNLNRKVMLREFMTYDEVMSQLRLHGIEDIADVEHAFVEPNGMVSVIRAHAETAPPGHVSSEKPADRE